MLHADLQSVWQILPNQQTGRLEPKNPVIVPVVVSGVVQRPSAEGPITSAALGTEREVNVFVFPAAGLHGYVPESGWHYVDKNNKRWVINSVRSHLDYTAFYCECVEDADA